MEYAHQISKLTQELGEKMQDERTVKGHICLAMPDSLCDSLLGEQFLDFRKRYPGITLKIIEAGTEEMFRLINHNEADAILTLDNHIYNTEYVIVREEKMEMHFVADAKSPLCHSKTISVQELIHQPCTPDFQDRLNLQRHSRQFFIQQSAITHPSLSQDKGLMYQFLNRNREYRVDLFSGRTGSWNFVFA